jgi:hypothetical protein
MSQSLSKNAAMVLYSVWKISGKKKRATYSDIEQDTGLMSSNVRKIVSEINKMSDKYLESVEEYENSKSKPLTAFCLPQSVVILPETAKILLELFEMEPEPDKPHRINVEKFVANVEEKHNFGVEFIQNRIELGITSGYIQKVSDSSIWVEARVLRELEFIKLLADYKIAVGKGG